MISNSSGLGVVILAAGKGTRMCSEKPKVLHPVCGLSLIERTMRVAAELNPVEISLVVGYKAQEVEAEITRFSDQDRYSGITIHIAEQKEQLGTGDAARIGLEPLSTDVQKVLILAGDTPLLEASIFRPLLEGVTAFQGNESLGMLTTFVDVPDGFGRIVRDSEGKIQSITEHKDCTSEQLEINEINVSIYLASRSFLEQSLSSLGTENAQGELYLTDIVAAAVSGKVSIETAVVATEELVLGANDRAQLAELEALRRSELVYSFMAKGVHFEDPATVYLDEDVEIEPDSSIGACCWLRGKTRVLGGAVIEGNCQLTDSVVQTGAQIRFGSVLEEAIVGENSTVGPFARLRPATKLGKGVKIGNFVETKKASFEDGSKASHLSYIGDAEVGADANIGAGTITCNYDGVNKHRTSIGPGAFIGSNTALVAPVSVGKGAFVGAGSVITKTVPDKSLGLSRSKQSIIENWAEDKGPKSKPPSNKGKS